MSLRATEAFASLDANEAAAAAQDMGAAREQGRKVVPIVPIPDDATPMRFRHPSYGDPTRCWAYRNAEARLVGYACRFDLTKDDGLPSKVVLPVTFCDLGGGEKGLARQGHSEPRPLISKAAFYGPRGPYRSLPIVILSERRRGVRKSDFGNWLGARTREPLAP